MNAVYGKCSDCGFVFIIAKLPMELEKASRLMARASCAACGAIENIKVASAEEAVEAEARAAEKREQP